MTDINRGWISEMDA